MAPFQYGRGDPERMKQYPKTRTGFLIPKSHFRKKDGSLERVSEVVPEMINLVTGENLISFGTGG